MGLTTAVEAERYERDKAQRVGLSLPGVVLSLTTCLQISAKQSSFRDAISLGYERPTAIRQRPAQSNSSHQRAPVARPTTSVLTLATASSLHLLTALEKELCATLRILPRPYLYLKEILMREWVRKGGNMDMHDAREAIGIRGEGGTQGMGRGASGEWGEKIDRVWEFLVESGGLRKPVAVAEPVTDQALANGHGHHAMEVDGTAGPSS